MSTEDALLAELDVLRAIYGDSSDGEEVCVYNPSWRTSKITFPIADVAGPRATLTVNYPAQGYPSEAPPQCRLSAPCVDKSCWTLAELDALVLALWREEAKGVMLYPLIETLRPPLAEAWVKQQESTAPLRQEPTSSVSVDTLLQHVGWTRDMIAISDTVTDRKSAFVGCATPLPTADILPMVVQQMLPLLLPKADRATHCMYAYTTPDGASEHDDGGESGAGTRLMRFLQFQSANTFVQKRGCLIVVYRWYGGTHLGSDRWRHILTCAKDAWTRLAVQLKDAIE